MELTELKALLKILNAQGVTQYTTPELTLSLSGVTPSSGKSRAEEVMGDSEPELTPAEEAERILFYSAGTPLEAVKD